MGRVNRTSNTDARVASSTHPYSRIWRLDVLDGAKAKGVEEYVSLPYSPPSSVYSSRLGPHASLLKNWDDGQHPSRRQPRTAPRYNSRPRLPSLLKNSDCRPILPRWGNRWRDFLFGRTSHAASRLQTYTTRVDPRRLPTLIRGSCFLGRDSCALGRASSLSTSRACWNRCSGLLFFAEQKPYPCLVLEKPFTSALCVSQQGE